jgi:hypothetical protein
LASTFRIAVNILSVFLGRLKPLRNTFKRTEIMVAKSHMNTLVQSRINLSLYKFTPFNSPAVSVISALKTAKINQLQLVQVVSVKQPALGSCYS